MKYVIPIAIEQADAVKLLGTLPQTATQTRNALANVVADLIRKQASQRDAPPKAVFKASSTPEPSALGVEKTKTPTESVETPKKSTRKTSKKSDA